MISISRDIGEIFAVVKDVIFVISRAWDNKSESLKRFKTKEIWEYRLSYGRTRDEPAHLIG